MKLYTRKEAIERMNILAGNNRPFIFIIDYKQEKVFIEEIKNVDCNKCLFSFNGLSNSDNDDDNKYGEVKWKYELPTFDSYKDSFDIVVSNMLIGNSYLINLTCKVPIETNLSMKDIFQHSKAMYKLWMKDEFVCFSPEIFVRIENGIISSYPMKGTIDASLPKAEEKLIEDEKEAAEHATIVDLIRNDLSMVANKVSVEDYRYIDKLMTNKGPILQTSTKITGELPDDYCSRIGDIIFKLLPAGSITGAPKEKTVQIIDEAEGYERGFYTGIMGYYKDKCLDSAVMIRFIDCDGEQLYFKAGGGITAKSNCKSEYEEVQQKIYVPIY